jgi:protein-S-isoprenylcysteine O-methyltransferase Ste14
VVNIDLSATMTARTKVRSLIFAFVVPYFVLVMYFAIRVSEHPLPSWLPYFGMSYLLATMIVISILSRRIYRATPKESPQRPRPVLQGLARGWASYLVLVWSIGFVWGAYHTIRGDFPWQRALPAGAFLLVFIGIFARLVYKDMKRPASTSDSNRDPTQSHT